MDVISIIGAGQLGSRHLQALAKLNRSIKIQVVDPNKESLDIAKARFNELADTFKGEISFHSNLSELEKNQTVVIIATNSRIRKKVIEDLLEHSVVENLILEKFLFTIEEDYSEINSLLKRKNIKAWVNCPRRMVEFYQNLRSQLQGNIHFHALGNNWGLGCNGIHMLDLFAFLTNTDDIQLTNQCLDDEVINSKREGYVEFTGSIAGYTKKHCFQITSFKNDNSPFVINISTSNLRCIIEEGSICKVWLMKLENNWKCEEETFTIPFQSQLSNLIIDEILETGNCSLTTYNESAKLHVALLKTLLEHVQKTTNDYTLKECKIT